MGAEGQKKIFSVSELTADIKFLLERKFSFVWVFGEISNFRRPASGHLYFTLKDENAQISGVMFRGQTRNLKFMPEDGMTVTGIGRLSVYEPRGAYQIIFEYMEPKGVGALQIAFEKLKAKLAEEGLFDKAHKKPIPFMPNKIAVLSSPTGAVVHDIIHVVARRYPNVHITVFPIKVQGQGAEDDIVSAVELLNDMGDADAAILARGGGSLEDLSAFNSEKAARAIFASQIPVISAVGHETDYTIADFVADLRAPTPSAAAEMVVPVKQELFYRVTELTNRLTNRFLEYLKTRKQGLDHLNARLVHPRKKIEDLKLRLDDEGERLFRAMRGALQVHRERSRHKRDRLRAAGPMIRIQTARERRDRHHVNLGLMMQRICQENQSRLREASSRLRALSPMAVLKRGYSITRALPDLAVVRDADAVDVGLNVSVRLSRGTLTCRVEGKSNHEE